MPNVFPLDRAHLDRNAGALLYALDGDVGRVDWFQALSERSPGETSLDVLHRYLKPGGVLTTEVAAHVARGGQDGARYGLAAREIDELESRVAELGWPPMMADRVIKARWSLATPNRSNIVVENEAWDVEAFRNTNPVGLWNHESGGMCTASSPDFVIARWIEVRHERKTPKSPMIGFAELVPPNIHRFGQVVLELYRWGALNAFSPGFIVHEARDPEESDEFPDVEIVFTKAELVELSFVVAPRHPGAVRMAVANGAVSVADLRSCVGRHLEVAYGDDARVVERPVLERWATELGISDHRRMVELGADVRRVEPAAPSGRLPDIEFLRCARSDDEDFDASRIAGQQAAWRRFQECRDFAAAAVTLEDETLEVLARAAGLSFAAIGEEDPVEPLEPPVEISSGPPEWLGFAVAEATRQVSEVLASTVVRWENATGRLVVPTDQQT